MPICWHDFDPLIERAQARRDKRTLLGARAPAAAPAPERLTVTVDLDDLLHVLRAAVAMHVSSDQLVRLANAAAIVRTDATAERERREDAAR